MEKWTGPLTPVNIRVWADLHAAMKVAAAGRGMTVEQGYGEAATRWLNPSGGPLGELTKTEEDLAVAAVRYYREAPEEDMLRQFFGLLLRTWGRTAP